VSACGGGKGERGIIYLLNATVECLECCERQKEGYGRGHMTILVTSAFP
jgi:hypothetical protein